MSKERREKSELLNWDCTWNWFQIAWWTITPGFCILWSCFWTSTLGHSYSVSILDDFAPLMIRNAKSVDYFLLGWQLIIMIQIRITPIYRYMMFQAKSNVISTAWENPLTHNFDFVQIEQLGCVCIHRHYCYGFLCCLLLVKKYITPSLIKVYQKFQGTDQNPTPKFLM